MMTMTTRFRLACGGRPRVRRQRGVSLLFALMTLVALSLAAVALIRSVDTGALIIGNLGFKEDTLLASEEATRQALDYVQTAGNTAGTLEADVTASGYYFKSPEELDVTGVSTSVTRTIIDWKLDGCASFEKDSYKTCAKPVATQIDLPNGVWARYLVMRMCTPTSTATDHDCLGPTSTSSGDTLDSGELKGGENLYAKSKGQQYYFRVVVRTEGTRGAVTYTESIAHNYAGEKKASTPVTPTE
jgi:type IV pilus assembly protein PilX